MTCHPRTTKEPLTDCCKEQRNLDWSYGNGIEFEVYSCQVCKKEVAVDIEIQRDWNNAERVKEASR